MRNPATYCHENDSVINGRPSNQNFLPEQEPLSLFSFSPGAVRGTQIEPTI